MKKHSQATKILIVYVCYYDKDMEVIATKVRCISKELCLNIDSLLVVNNSGSVLAHTLPDEFESTITDSDNKYWEFSAYLKGLNSVPSSFQGKIVVMNDTFLRNWNITLASRSLLRSLVELEEKKAVGVWKDAVRWPWNGGFQSCVNSRLFVVNSEFLRMAVLSIEASIARASSYSFGERSSYLSKTLGESRLRLMHLEVIAGVRWRNQAFEDRVSRIYLEHTIFESIEKDLLKVVPNGVVPALFYSTLKRVFRERR